MKFLLLIIGGILLCAETASAHAVNSQYRQETIQTQMSEDESQPFAAIAWFLPLDGAAKRIFEDKLPAKQQGMKVVYAYYGVSCANGNHEVSNQIQTTKWAAGLCDGKNYCSGLVHTSVLTDPYYGCKKDFIVMAECSDGRVVADLVEKEAQGREFALSCE